MAIFKIIFQCQITSTVENFFLPKLNSSPEILSLYIGIQNTPCTKLSCSLSPGSMGLKKTVWVSLKGPIFHLDKLLYLLTLFHGQSQSHSFRDFITYDYKGEEKVMWNYCSKSIKYLENKNWRIIISLGRLQYTNNSCLGD